MEGVGVNAAFWRGKRVLLTGHTGFKGSWLSLWLRKLGADVAGYALPPASPDNLFHLAAVGQELLSVYADLRSRERLQELFSNFQPEIVFHLAAQALVRSSYVEPVETYHVNVMGTIYLLEEVRKTSSCRVVVNVTSDKCYENKEWTWGYRECDPMGGHDPYSSSKGCAELVTAAYRRSFLDARDSGRVAVASARAGNVIGGGDFAKDRLIPDFMSAIGRGKPLQVRNPNAVRPWQHVLEPLSGYLLLAEKLWTNPDDFAQGWNFGPAPDDIRSVRWIVEELTKYYGESISWEIDSSTQPHEANLLVLDSAKARAMLGWKPRWPLERALRAVVDWHKSYLSNEPLRSVVMEQISHYEASAAMSSDLTPSAYPSQSKSMALHSMQPASALLRSAGSPRPPA
jgi:CDP-glucose 4,6-dehydratase